MKQAFNIFFWGLLISFLGSLPLGTMNVTATNISVTSGEQDAMIFAAGTMIVEIILVRIALVTMAWIQKQKRIFRLLEWVTLLLIAALAVGSFIAAINMTGFGTAIPGDTDHPFLLGMFLSITNPLHLPFWLGWSAVLADKNILKPGRLNYNLYITGIGIGTMAGFSVFIYGGNYLVKRLNENSNILNWVIAIILFITAIIQCRKMFAKTTAVTVRN